MTAKPVASALRRTVGATRAKPSFTVNGYPLSQTIAMAIAVMMTAAPVRSRNACLASTPADVRCCAASRVAIVWMPRSVALSRMALRASTSENSPKRLGPKYRVTIGIEISDAARDRARAPICPRVFCATVAVGGGDCGSSGGRLRPRLATSPLRRPQGCRGMSASPSMVPIRPTTGGPWSIGSSPCRSNDGRRGA